MHLERLNMWSNCPGSCFRWVALVLCKVTMTLGLFRGVVRVSYETFGADHVLCRI